MTSSTDRQVRLILWKELRRVYKAARFPIGGKLAIDPATGLQFEDGREIVGFSTKDPEKMAGISSPNLLYIVDEASGVGEPIFEAIEGNRAGGAKLVAFSNPTQTSGTFFSAFHEKRALWHTIQISSAESPNVTKTEKAIPGLADPAWIAEKVEDWGIDSPIYAVRVLGNFPSTAEDAIVGLLLLDEATGRWEETAAEGPLEFGVDVARFGDDSTAIAPRRGQKIFPLVCVQGFDNVQVVGKVLETARALRIGNERVRVKIDVTGGHGTGPADILRAMHSEEVDVVDVNSSSKSDTPEKFPNLRSQLHFGFAEWLREGGALPANDGKLEGEVVAPKYSFDPQGRRKVESKDEIKKRLGRSPDRGDAVMLAVYRGGSVAVEDPGAISGANDDDPSRWGEHEGRGFG
jgi:phage terminase large subunit